MDRVLQTQKFHCCIMNTKLNKKHALDVEYNIKADVILSRCGTDTYFCLLHNSDRRKLH